MRAVLQRVTEARVAAEGEVVGAIGPGLLALVGVAAGDTEEDAGYVADKIADLRLFDDADGKINRSLAETGGGALVVSQFTLLGDCRKGRRPSWSDAAAPGEAERLYRAVVARLRARGVPTETGTFRAEMAVSLTNDGPVTVLLDSRKTF
jgi:D-tyrosyl-tRNA(Tyr) deacylase